jgi:hypothetical protein
MGVESPNSSRVEVWIPSTAGKLFASRWVARRVFVRDSAWRIAVRSINNLRTCPRVAHDLQRMPAVNARDDR